MSSRGQLLLLLVCWLSIIAGITAFYMRKPQRMEQVSRNSLFSSYLDEFNNAVRPEKKVLVGLTTVRVIDSHTPYTAMRSEFVRSTQFV